MWIASVSGLGVRHIPSHQRGHHRRIGDDVPNQHVLDHPDPDTSVNCPHSDTCTKQAAVGRLNGLLGERPTGIVPER
jgi:hypothetical protein